MTAWMQTLGGVGLFLFGMAAMSSGLRKLAGDRLRGWLAGSTRNVFAGALTGTLVTAVVQSSSATTVAAVGFVSAGLMTFTQSLGIIFGANIGTTLTGWMVAVVGFELDLKAVALPLLFVGALLYLIKPVRVLRGGGKALCGFCLIFLGIGYLQEGLTVFEGAIDLSGWTTADVGGRLLLVGMGILLTLITQSSSATVAMAVTALNTSVLSLPQAAAIVIGADIGTTATAALATVGGSAASRRTGMAHVVYNMMTGVMAFGLMPLYLWGVSTFAEGAAEAAPEMVVVAFHSLFNILGVLLILPFARSFGRLIQWMIPDREGRLESTFDMRLLEDAAVAMTALESGSRAVAGGVLDLALRALDEASRVPAPEERMRLLGAIERARDYAVRIGQAGDVAGSRPERILAFLHLLDHAERLVDRVSDRERVKAARALPELAARLDEVELALRGLSALMRGDPAVRMEGELGALSASLDEDKPAFRQKCILEAAEGKRSGEVLDRSLDAHRWLRRVTYHGWRIAYYAESGNERSTS